MSINRNYLYALAGLCTVLLMGCIYLMAGRKK
jgi:hypothetical protein